MREAGASSRRAVGATSRAPRRTALRPAARPRTTSVRPSAVLEDPYRTLGVPAGADEREIKRAYRRLALKYHPDVNQADAEAGARFVSIQQAYEVLTGRRPGAAASGHYTRNQHNNWEFQDWFWSFTASRRWSAQHHARPPGEAAEAGARAPQERAVLNSQLAGLRQRAAIRHTKAARGGGPGEAAAGAEEPGGAAAQQQEQPRGATGQHGRVHGHHQQQHQPRHHDPQQQQHEQQQEPPRWRPPPPPPVEYDTTAMSDGVNIAAGEGYDPWSPEAAAAARRPKFTATETVKTQVCGQLGGLKRRAAAKRRADEEEERRRQYASSAPPPAEDVNWDLV